eukprot:3042152-Karenia_brevis.AAC.1
MEEILLLVAKMAMGTSQTSRMLKSIMAQCYKVPVDHWVVVAAESGTLSFTNAANNLRAEGATSDMVREQLGTPNIHAFNA